MGAPYRHLQSDFSAGQIDPMVEANLNYSMKQIGLKESYNTIHNANKTVSRRPGTSIYDNQVHQVDDCTGSASITLPDGKTVMFEIDGDSALAWCNGNSYDLSTSFTSVGSGPFHMAVYQNFLYMVGPTISLVRVWKFAESGGSVTATEMTGKWGTKPTCVSDNSEKFSSCCFANGRLCLTRGNVVYISRIRVAGEATLTEDADGFPLWTLDFTLSDNGNVYASHAVEVRENDMYSSRIRWIAYIGRIIVGTESAIFISTTQAIDPTTFDLVITSSYGTCDIQPNIVSNMLIFLSSDRRKLYSAYFDSDYQGLIVGDITSNARNMFFNGIRRFWAFDYPELSMYAVTNDDKTFFCQPSYMNGSLIFAWSEWEFGGTEKPVPVAVYHERLITSEEHSICMLLYRTGSVQMHRVMWKEPYDDDTSRPVIDYMDSVAAADMVKSDNSVSFPVYPTNGCISGNDNVTAFLTASGSSPIVIRNLVPHEGGNQRVVAITVPKNVEGWYKYKAVRNGSQYPDSATLFETKALAEAYVEAHDPSHADEYTYSMSTTLVSTFAISYGIEFVSRITLFQQILPNNSGIALSSKHSITELSLMVYRSFGGYLEVAGMKSGDLPYLKYGSSYYSADMYNFAVSGTYQYSGVMKITNPRYRGVITADNPARDVLEDDRVAVVVDGPFPFNLMAISIKYIITEVN